MEKEKNKEIRTAEQVQEDLYEAAYRRNTEYEAKTKKSWYRAAISEMIGMTAVTVFCLVHVLLGIDIPTATAVILVLLVFGLNQYNNTCRDFWFAAMETSSQTVSKYCKDSSEDLRFKILNIKINALKSALVSRENK